MSNLKSKSNSLLLAPALLLLTLLATGCGSQNLATVKKSTAVGVGGVATGSSSITTTTDGTSTSSGSTGTGTPYTFTINGTGYNPVAVTVKAGQVIKVKFTPGRQNRGVTGTGYTFQYSILGVFIKVGNSTQATPPLNNGYYAAAESTTAMDFSASDLGSCSASSTTCRQNVTITVQQPNSDENCIYYGTGCPQNHVPDNHPWNGTLTVQTDDTTAI